MPLLPRQELNQPPRAPVRTPTNQPRQRKPRFDFSPGPELLNKALPGLETPDDEKAGA